MTPMEWNGRAVTVSEFNIRVGRDVRKAFAISNEDGSYACLAASLHYVDTGEAVFQSADEVEDQPFRLSQRVLLLAAEAAKVNGMFDDDDDAERVADGSGKLESPGPSP